MTNENIELLKATGNQVEQSLDGASRTLHRKTHQTIRKVTIDINDKFHFNTAISAVMELTNTLYALTGEQNTEDILKILSMAIDSETEANEHYRKMADETIDPTGKEMFLKLADEETLHRRILSDEFYHLSNQGNVWVWGD